MGNRVTLYVILAFGDILMPHVYSQDDFMGCRQNIHVSLELKLQYSCIGLKAGDLTKDE